MEIIVRALTAENREELPVREYPYTVWGRLKLRFDGRWTWTEEINDQPYTKLFPVEDDRDEYLEAEDRAAFLAYADGTVTGSIKLELAWNRYAFIWDIGVKPEYRGRGVGTALLEQAERWAREKGMKGFALEAQDVNLPASRFYQKQGFEIGGVNTRLYSNFPHCQDEIAVFWYKSFSCEA